MMKEVLADKDPTRWSSFYNILTIRKRFMSFGWSLLGKSSKSNKVVDLSVEFILANCWVLGADEFQQETSRGRLVVELLWSS